MKLSLMLLALLTLSPLAHATAFDDALELCGVRNPQCRETARSCRQALACERGLLRSIRYTWYRRKIAGTRDQLAACTEALESQQVNVEALETTIDCVDTADGPRFGG